MATAVNRPLLWANAIGKPIKRPMVLLANGQLQTALKAEQEEGEVTIEEIMQEITDKDNA